MKQRDLTNERLTKLFVSSCALANFAIFVARKSIENDTYTDLRSAVKQIPEEAEAVEESEKESWGIL